LTAHTPSPRIHFNTAPLGNPASAGKLLRGFLLPVLTSRPGRLKAHLHAFPDLSHLGLNLKGMGVPDGWEADW
jgi:hypothetical protein